MVIRNIVVVRLDEQIICPVATGQGGTNEVQPMLLGRHKSD